MAAQANGGLSNDVKDTFRSRADRSTLIKAQLSTLNVATKRGTSDKTEATRFSQCSHDQRRKLEAEDCSSIRCAQLISGGRRRIHPPHCLAHARPTMCCIRLVYTVIIIIIYILSNVRLSVAGHRGFGVPADPTSNSAGSHSHSLCHNIDGHAIISQGQWWSNQPRITQTKNSRFQVNSDI